MLSELIPLIMFFVVCLVLVLGYPVAFTLAGTALLFAAAGMTQGLFDANLLLAFPDRLFGIMTNTTLIAVPLFVLMGVILEKSRLAEDLLSNMAILCGKLPGGLGIAVIIVGMLLAASTGIVGATVVTMGLISLPTMLERGYCQRLATGTICATGTLGQIIPPSIALVLLGDVISSAYQQSQINSGVFSPAPVSVGDLFVGAIFPGLLLVVLYISYVVGYALLNPDAAPAIQSKETRRLSEVLKTLLPPILLMILVLGSIMTGLATPTEAAGVGAMGAAILAWKKKQLSVTRLGDIVRSTTQVTTMVFAILIGASLFSLVFRGFGGEVLIEHFFSTLPGGAFTAMFVVMAVIFLLGFILDFIEITFVVVPLVGPALLSMGLDPVWLGIMIALNLQTSFLTPPFGFALFYLRGVAPESVPTRAIYRGVTPFIMLQLLLLLALAQWPAIVTWLPDQLR